jgi:hypothetical protein
MPRDERVKGIRVDRCFRGVIAACVMVLVPTACGGGGAVPPDRVSFDVFSAARPANPEPAGGRMLLAPPEGQEPNGDASGDRMLDRGFGPQRHIRLAASEDRPSVFLIATTMEADPGTQDWEPSEGVRSVDINGRQGAAYAFGDMRFVVWNIDAVKITVSGLGDEKRMLDVARGVELRGQDARDIHPGHIPDGYEISDDERLGRGTAHMAILTYVWRGSPPFSGVSIVTAFVDGVDPRSAIGELSGSDQPEGYEWTTVRGADAALLTQAVRGPGDDELRTTTLMWLERPDVVVMLQGFGDSSEGSVLRNIAEGLRGTSRDDWDRRFPNDGSFSRFDD